LQKSFIFLQKTGDNTGGEGEISLQFIDFGGSLLFSGVDLQIGAIIPRHCQP
jgi:hypothetical protein